MDEKKRILIVSSVPITHFGNLGLDRVTALEELGYEVDYLTKYQDNDPHVIGVYPSPKIYNCLRGIKNRMPSNVVNLLRKIWPSLFPSPKIKSRNGIEIKSPNENMPHVDNDTLLSLINPIYCFVHILAWQDMITSISIKAIYDKLRVPIIISPVDFQPFTGGCFYFNKCRNFESGCGNCPVYEGNEEDDLTRQNFQIKKEIYNSINCGFIVNPYTMEFLRKTKIIPEERLQVGYYSMDENLYKPLDKQECMRELGISNNKKYIILSRFSSLKNIRKGCHLLPEIINSFAKRIGDDKKNVLLVFAGGQDVSFEKEFNIDVLNIGVLDTNKLIQAYSAVDIFVSTSIDDAGPSMVNQAIMCGTPVLAFNIGSALYMIENGKTGYMVPLLDTEAMINSLVEHFYLSSQAKKIIKDNCREKGLETGSREVSAKNRISFATRLAELKVI